jgi:hypothetical protein
MEDRCLPSVQWGAGVPAILFPVFSAAHAPVVQMAHKFAVEIDSATAPPANKASMIAPQKPTVAGNRMNYFDSRMIYFDHATSPPDTKSDWSPDGAHTPPGDVQQTGEHDGQFGRDEGTQGTGKPAPMPNAEANVSDKFSMQKATYEQSKPTPGMPAAGIPVQNRVGRIEFKT